MSGSANSKVAHTLAACCRCRSRKTRCDANLPRCSPCERSNEHCEYFDTVKGRRISRTYVIHLQHKVQALEEELACLSEDTHRSPDAELMARSAGYVRFEENDEPKYLGPSSGIAITRLVMELAKQKTDTKSIKEIVPENRAQQIKDRFRKEEGKPTSKVYPMISDVAAPSLPTRDLTDHLVEIFYQKAQYNLPTLHEPTFLDVVQNVYDGSVDPYKNFTIRMVLAISMQKLDTMYAGLADSYYLAALPFLENAVKPMDLGSLQCFALIAQYSLLTPTRTAAYWVVGLAARLCQALGITEEAMITPINHCSTQFDALEIDMRRRLFWVITSMEFGLAHSLGRPSAFGTTFDHIDVKFFQTVDDRYITPAGIIPGSPRSLKKSIAIHFFRMRLLQAEIRRKLYLRKRAEPKNDGHPWFQEMETKLDRWRQSSPTNDEGSGLSETWFVGRYNTMIVFLYRPSPQVPKPSVAAARKCFDASQFNIYMQRDQIASRSVDLTWIFTQSLFMALNSILWALSYVEIRREHPKAEVESHILVAQEAIALASERWPGVESALELYHSLITACLKAYDGKSETAQAVESTSDGTSPASLQDAVTPPSLPSPYIFNSSPRYDNQVSRLSLTGCINSDSGYGQATRVSPPPSDYSSTDSTFTGSLHESIGSQQSSYPITSSFVDHSLNPASIENRLPQMLPPLRLFPAIEQGRRHYLGSIGDQYSQYLHAPFISQQPLQTLNQEQQIELMRNLEKDGLEWG